MDDLFYIKKFVRDDGEQLALDGVEILLSEDNAFMAAAEIATTAVEYTEADGAERVRQKITTSEQEINGLIVPKTSSYWELDRKLHAFFQINHDYKIVYKEKGGTMFATAWGWISSNIQITPRPREDYGEWYLALTIGSPHRTEYSEDGSGKEQYANSVALHLLTDNLGGEVWDGTKEVLKIEDLVYLQDFAKLATASLQMVVDSMTEEQVYKLKDSRDQKEYNIIKLKDGSVLMDNLRLVGKTISSADSDMEEGEFEVPNDEASAFKTVETDVEANHAYLDAKHGEEYGAHYTWYCATAGSGNKSLVENGQKAPSSIAPKGWRLLTEEDVQSIISAYDITDDTAGSTAMTSAPLNFKYGAYVRYDNGAVASNYWGTEGLLWYPTAATNPNRANCLDISTSRVYNKAERRVYGFNVRCILRQPEQEKG